MNVKQVIAESLTVHLGSLDGFRDRTNANGKTIAKDKIVMVMEECN